MEDRSLLVSAIIVISLLMLVFFVPDEQGEPRELRKARPYVSIQVSIPLPNTEYAFKVKENYKNAEKAIWQVNKIQEHIDTVMLPTVELKKTNLGKYYITGYTAWELGGSTATASGATCHKASSYEDSFFNPTTCAIDPSLHNFSDLFYIEQFGCFIAEDTGSAIIGKHLDLYYGTTYEDNQEALKITGYYTVYAIEFVYGEVPATNYDIQGQVADKVIGWKLTDEMKGITE